MVWNSLLDVLLNSFLILMALFAYILFGYLIYVIFKTMDRQKYKTYEPSEEELKNAEIESLKWEYDRYKEWIKNGIELNKQMKKWITDYEEKFNIKQSILK
jgi:uncharacterized membrane protein YraQ (UPF0718 family)